MAPSNTALLKSRDPRAMRRTRDPGAMRRSISGVAALLLVFIVGAAPALADSVPGIGSDPDDAASDKPDLSRLAVEYDELRGRITATFDLHPSSWTIPSLYLRFGLSRPGSGGCKAETADPDLDFRAAGDFENIGIRGSVTLHPRTGHATALYDIVPVEGLYRYTYSFEAQEFVAAGYRCVTHVFADSDSFVEDGDRMDGFCLGAADCFARPSPSPSPDPAPPTPPAAPSLSEPQAQRYAKDALTRVYRQRFTAGERYRSSCRRKSASTRVCHVSWRYRRYRFRGRVVVKARDDGVFTNVRVRRVGLNDRRTGAPNPAFRRATA